MVTVEATGPLEAWASELVSCHFYHIPLVKASHKTSPDKRVEEEFQKFVAIFNLPHGF